MPNERRIRQKEFAFIMTILVIIFGIVLAVLLTRFLGFYKLEKVDLSWGLTIHYNYYIFGFLYVLACLLSLFLKMKPSIWINSLLILIYSYPWILSYPEYPNRVFAIFLSSFSIYALGQVLIIKSKKRGTLQRSISSRKG